MPTGLSKTPGAFSVQLIAGILISGLVVATALLSLIWTPVPPEKMQLLSRLRPPLESGLLGTDHYGHDVLSMLMAGAWHSLSIAALSVFLGSFFGILAGLLAAGLRGLVEGIVMRFCDVFFAVPPLLSALLLGAYVGTGRFSIVSAIAIFMVPVFARIAFTSALRVWAQDYVLAARALGNSRFSISIRHILPNIADQLIAQLSLQLGFAILMESALGFLGFGIAPPTPTWGRMLAQSQTFLPVAPWLALAPGLAIAISVFGFNLLGNGLNHYLDPRTRKGQ